MPAVRALASCVDRHGGLALQAFRVEPIDGVVQDQPRFLEGHQRVDRWIEAVLGSAAAVTLAREQSEVSELRSDNAPNRSSEMEARAPSHLRGETALSDLFDECPPAFAIGGGEEEPGLNCRSTGLAASPSGIVQGCHDESRIGGAFGYARSGDGCAEEVECEGYGGASRRLTMVEEQVDRGMVNDQYLALSGGGVCGFLRVAPGIEADRSLLYACEPAAAVDMIPDGARCGHGRSSVWPSGNDFAGNPDRATHAICHCLFDQAVQGPFGFGIEPRLTKIGRARVGDERPDVGACGTFPLGKQLVERTQGHACFVGRDLRAIHVLRPFPVFEQSLVPSQSALAPSGRKLQPTGISCDVIHVGHSAAAYHAIANVTQDRMAYCHRPPSRNYRSKSRHTDFPCKHYPSRASDRCKNHPFGRVFVRFAVGYREVGNRLPPAAVCIARCLPIGRAHAHGMHPPYAFERTGVRSKSPADTGWARHSGRAATRLSAAEMQRA